MQNRGPLPHIGASLAQLGIERMQVHSREVQRIIAHRWNPLARQASEESYLIEWKPAAKASFKAFSWHVIEELDSCLDKIQQYIERLNEARSQRQLTLSVPGQHLDESRALQAGATPTTRKRKSPSSDLVSISSSSSKSSGFVPNKRHASPARSAITISSDEEDTTQRPASTHPTLSHTHDWLKDQTYNGHLETVHIGGVAYLQMKPWETPLKPHQRLAPSLPTDAMIAHTLNPRNTTSRAEYEIQKAFRRNLAQIKGPLVSLDPNGTGSAPPLNFSFINDNVLGDGVIACPDEAVTGCGMYREDGGHGGQHCRPHMGAHQGCEYSRVCECLEYAPVEDSRLTAEQRARRDAGDLMGLPKRFPYTSPSARTPFALTDFYLNKRNMIYECNARCACGPACKTRVVQRGRSIPLQIFKTDRRGWGLRTPLPLRRGHFIDTYRGEIITNAEAEARERAAPSARTKDSYLYDLDKHDLAGLSGLGGAGGDGGSAGGGGGDFYVMDGESVGGPTRFMNHSCAPNCRQYCVSMNKNDVRIYELAFFAWRDIEAGEELTFDYLDRDDDDDDDGAPDDPDEADADAQEQAGKTHTRCLCGADNCRKWLWT